MSEAETQKEDLQKKEQEPAAPPGKKASGGSGVAMTLSSLALLIGLAGAGAAGYTFWLQQNLQKAQAQQSEASAELLPQVMPRVEDNAQKLQQLESLTQQASNRLNSASQSLSQRLDAFPSPADLDERRRLLASLQSDQQRLTVRVERVLGASREDWRLAEAEHLVRMAMVRLSAMKDVNSAAALLYEADLILQKQDDPGSYSTRQKLLESLETLRSLPKLDLTGLFLQLSAIRGRTSELTSMAPEYQVVNTDTLSPEEAAKLKWWDQALYQVSRYVRLDLEAVNNVKPLLAGQSLAQVRLALALAIEQAQWAVLNGNTEVYRQSLAQAQGLLKDHFAKDDLASQALSERIGELAKRQVAIQLPDLTPTLRALEAYILERQQATQEAVKKANKQARFTAEEEVRT